MPDTPTGPTPPATSTTPATPATPTAPALYTPEQVRQMELARKDFDDFSRLLKESSTEAFKFKEEISSLENSIRKSAESAGSFETRLNSYSNALKASIKRTEEFAGALETQYEESVRNSAREQKELTDELEKFNKIFPDVIDSLSDAEEAIRKFQEAESEARATLDPEAYEVYKDALEKINEQIAERTDLTQEEINIIIKSNIVSTDENTINEVSEKLNKTVGFRLAENLALKIKSTKASQEKAAAEREELQAVKALNDLAEKQDQSLLTLNNSMSQYVDKVLTASGDTNLMTKAIYGMSKGAGEATKSILDGITKAVLDPEKAMNRLFNFMKQNIITSTFEFDKTLASVNKTTGGMGKEFEKVALNQAGMFSASSVSGLAGYGVGLKEVGDAYAAISNRMSSFNSLSEAQRKTLMVNAAVMEKLGVSASTYANLTSNLIGAVGKTAEGSKEVINRLAKDAIGAGTSVAEYTKEFDQLLPRLIAYGKEATQTFKELNALSKAVGNAMSASDMLTFAEKFETWGSAAEQVGKLNAALGGTSINIEDMMRADPTEKLLKIRRAMLESGTTWEQLNRGYQKMLAESFGGDLGKAAAFYKMNLEQANVYLSEQAASAKELEERQKKSSDASEKMAKALDGMKIALTPLVEAAGWIADKFAKLNESMHGFGGIVTGIIALAIPALIGGFKLFTLSAQRSLVTAMRDVSKSVQELRDDLAAARRDMDDLGSRTPVADRSDRPHVDTGSTTTDPRTGRPSSRSGRRGSRSSSRTPHTPPTPRGGRPRRIGGGLIGLLGGIAMGLVTDAVVNSATEAVTSSAAVDSSGDTPSYTPPTQGAVNIKINDNENIEPNKQILGVINPETGAYDTVSYLDAADKVSINGNFATGRTPSEASRTKQLAPQAPSVIAGSNVSNAASEATYNTQNTIGPTHAIITPETAAALVNALGKAQLHSSLTPAARDQLKNQMKDVSLEVSEAQAASASSRVSYHT